MAKEERLADSSTHAGVKARHAEFAAIYRRLAADDRRRMVGASTFA